MRNLILVIFSIILFACSNTTESKESVEFENTNKLSANNPLDGIVKVLNSLKLENSRLIVDEGKLMIDYSQDRYFLDYSTNNLIVGLIVYENRKKLLNQNKIEKIVFRLNEEMLFSFDVTNEMIQDTEKRINNKDYDKLVYAVSILKYEEVLALDQLIKYLVRYDTFDYEGFFWDLYFGYLQNCKSHLNGQNELYHLICLFISVDVYQELDLAPKINLLLQECGHDLNSSMSLEEVKSYMRLVAKP